MQLRIKITIWNASSLCKSRAGVEHYIKINNIDVLFVAKINFNDRSYFKIPGYKLIKANHLRGNARYAGIPSFGLGANLGSHPINRIRYSFVGTADFEQL